MKNKAFLLSVLVIYTVLIGVLLLAESLRPEANIQSLGDVLWYSVVTLTTVGYGDFYPVTPVGKIAGLVLVIGSLGLVGMMVGKITTRINEHREMKKMGLYGTDFQDHIVIVGWDEFARLVTTQLVNADNRVAIITDHKNDIDLIYEEYSKQQVFVLFADLHHTASFAKTNLNQAFLTFVNLGSDTDKLICVLNIKREQPAMRFLVALDKPDLKETFHGAGVSYVLSKTEIASKLIASYIFETDVADYTNDLLSSAKSADQYDIQEFKITERNPFLDKTYGEAFAALKKEHNVILIGLSRVQNGQRHLSKLPDDDVRLSMGDYLIMILNGAKEKVITDLFGVAEGVTRS